MRQALLDDRRNTASENPTLENQESDCMASDDGEEDAGYLLMRASMRR